MTVIRPIDVAHCMLNVTDLDRSIKFYTDLGFHISGKREAAVVWMNRGQFRDGDNLAFHNLGLFQVPNGAVEGYRKHAGLNHLAFRLGSPEEVDRAAEYLKSQNVKLLKGPLTHDEDKDRYLYMEDPDGNVIELVASTLTDYPQEYLRKGSQS